MDQIKCEIKGRMLNFSARLTESQVGASNLMISKRIAVEDFIATALKLDVEKILGLYEGLR